MRRPNDPLRVVVENVGDHQILDVLNFAASGSVPYTPCDIRDGSDVWHFARIRFALPNLLRAERWADDVEEGDGTAFCIQGEFEGCSGDLAASTGRNSHGYVVATHPVLLPTALIHILLLF